MKSMPAFSRVTSTFAHASEQDQYGLLFPLARKQARLPSRGFLTWCCSGDFNFLFLWLLSFSIASSLAFSHIDLLLESIKFIQRKDLPARRADPRIRLTLLQKLSGFHQRGRDFATSAIARDRTRYRGGSGYELKTATASTNIRSRSGTMMGGTTHSAKPDSRTTMLLL